MSPPPLHDALAADSVYTVGREADGVWPYEILARDDDDDVWVRIWDPYGGSALIPSLYAAFVTREAIAVREGRTGTVTLETTRTGIAAALALALIGGLSALVFPFILFRRRYRRERDERRRLQEVAHRLAESREDERLRIARELHDGPLQDLHALRLQLGFVADALAKSGDPRRVEVARVRGAHDETHTVIGELRAIAESLRPPALGPFGLAAALRAHADRFRRTWPDVNVDLDLDDDGQSLPESVRLALFRIAQEALTNAVKHGHPDRIALALCLRGNHVEIRIEDDGTGMALDPDAPDIPASGHFGILGMRERVGAVGGTLTIGQSQIGGVRVTASVPITPTAR